jgi:hypothetical protein
MKLLSIVNDEGRLFVVKRIDTGEAYGCDQRGFPNLRADKPMVEFYDATQTEAGPLGQLVSRYYTETLCNDEHMITLTGLQLDSNTPAWCVSGANLTQVIDVLCRG